MKRCFSGIHSRRPEEVQEDFGEVRVWNCDVER